MTTAIARILLQEDLNFLVTNRIPRRAASLLMAWFSHIESRPLTKLSVAVWRQFAHDLDLTEAEADEFLSLHDVFVRRLKDGSRPIDSSPSSLVSPCDAVVGAMGRVERGMALQAKGMRYPIEDLLHDDALIRAHEGGWFVTLRLRSSMYHRFHAPLDARVRRVTYISGDTWNVNPIALKRVERLFCKNERAIVELAPTDTALTLTMVPVAAILVAGIKLHCLEGVFNLAYDGPERVECDAAYEKGDELGYFQSGSTIVLFASGPVRFAPSVREGMNIRMGEPLLVRSFELVNSKENS